MTRGRRRPPRSEPQTLAGLFARALLLHDSAQVGYLNKYVNRGQDGWNSDEEALMQAASELAAQRLFGPGYDVRAVTAFASDMHSLAADSYSGAPSLLEMEAVIRSALGEADVDLGGISRAALYKVRGQLLAMAGRLLAISAQDAEELVVTAEHVAAGRGWSPPLAREVLPSQ